jgi:hypothetical protein
VCMPFAHNRAMYSHKGLVPAEGRLSVGAEQHQLSLADSHLLMDDHKGFYPRVMRWDWLTAAGRDRKGRLIGFNLTRNQCVLPEQYNENGFWIDGELHLLPAIQVDRPERRDRGRHPGERWTARDRRGLVRLGFEIEVDGRVDVNALVIQSKYRGPFGRFTGHLADGAGAELELDGLFGMGEDFYLRC